MTARTHDLAAVTTIVWLMTIEPIPAMSLATAVVSGIGVILGATAPDIDEPTSGLWNRIPAGSVIGRMIHPLVGGHRMISHSLLGLFLASMLIQYMLTSIQGVLLVDMTIVWKACMVGYISHLIMDTFTKDAIPLFFPLPWKIGFPPFRFLRITTGEMTEKSVIFPALMMLCGYLIWTHYDLFFHFLVSLKK